MTRKTHLRERELVRVDRLWRPDDGGAPLLVSFYLTEVDGCVRCAGYAVRTFLAVAERDESGEHDVWVEPARLRPDAPVDAELLDAMEARGEGPAFRVHADEELGEPFAMNATMVKAVPFGHLLDLAAREYAELHRLVDSALTTFGGAGFKVGAFRIVAAEPADPDEYARQLAAAGDVEAAGRPQGPQRQSAAPSLQHVAALYEASCRAGSTSPTRDVAEALSMPYSTVAKRIMKCREAGLLAPTRRGIPGGLKD